MTAGDRLDLNTHFPFSFSILHRCFPAPGEGDQNRLLLNSLHELIYLLLKDHGVAIS